MNSLALRKSKDMISQWWSYMFQGFRHLQKETKRSSKVDPQKHILKSLLRRASEIHFRNMFYTSEHMFKKNKLILLMSFQGLGPNTHHASERPQIPDAPRSSQNPDASFQMPLRRVPVTPSSVMWLRCPSRVSL